MNAPCEHCERKGCGAYHDICPEYQEYRQKNIEDYKKRVAKLNHRHDLNYVDHIHFMRLRHKNRK